MKSGTAQTTFSEVPVLNLCYVVKYADNQCYLGKLFLFYIENPTSNLIKPANKDCASHFIPQKLKIKFDDVIGRDRHIRIHSMGRGQSIVVNIHPPFTLHFMI